MLTIGDMNFERARLPLGVFETNTGQVEGLPANPRKWSKKEVERLAKSIKETPELLELRPVIALRHGDALVVLGGNLRLEAARLLKLDSVPVLIVEDTVPADKLKEIVIKDNGSFGEWDADLLAKDWGDVDLQAWGIAGVEMEDAEGEEAEAKEEGEKDKKVGSQLMVLGVSTIGENGDCVLVNEIPRDVADRVAAMEPSHLEEFGKSLLKFVAGYGI